MNISFNLFGKRIIVDISNWSDERSMRREWHKNGIWVTRDGQKISVEKMDDAHLLNIYFFLHRKAERLSTTLWAYPEPSGEAAQDAYYQELAYEDDMGGPPSKERVLASFPIYPHIVKELKRRGL